MGRFLRAIMSGVSAATEGPSGARYAAGGHPLRCPVCSNDRFINGSAQLNTAGMTFMNLDWANRSATTLACTECSRIEWFLEEPERVAG